MRQVGNNRPLAIQAARHDNRLCVRDLNDVYATLSKNDYDSTNYYQLGLQLGLHSSTLNAIENDHRTANRCLLACLEIWLKQKDSVTEPSWCKLVHVLKSLGENYAAEKIHNESKYFL